MNAAAEACAHIKPLPATISTITFTGRLSDERIRVEDIRLAAELAAEMSAELGGCLPEFDINATRVLTASRDGIRHQLPLQRRGKSVKLFHNGSVHATGCASPLEFLEVMEALSAFVLDNGNQSVSLVDFDIRLINALFVVTCPRTGRPLTVAPGAFASTLPTQADFDTERHPSVKIPIMEGPDKVATVCVFQTGSVSIMGARSPRHVAAAYAAVCEYLDAAAPTVCAPDASRTMRTTTARQPMCMAEGYPFAATSCCMF
jgi:hypothetical protein